MRSLVLLALVSGCTLYFDDDDEPPCAIPLTLDPGSGYRNPETGMCEQGPTPWPCDDRCGPCPAVVESALSLPDWGECVGECTGLDEATCMVTAGCRIAYANDPTNDAGPQFWACWAVAQSGPIQGGGCTGLAAQECSRHDDCTATYDVSIDTDGVVVSGDFASCAPEDALCISDSDCGTGERCTAGEEECLSGPGCDTPGGGCGGVCYGHCVPELAPACETLATEPACKSRTDCVPIYEGSDCTCTPTACDCNVLTYERCETK